ncbi:hypothetical protein [Comamonas sp. lk]|uniref:hypothetical protein n=1 Tax=Comamonas sp. lk TaxID=2201272 RepID=UPI000EB025D6|nr:hypothetical protein [Comamonas sp. lk]
MSNLSDTLIDRPISVPSIRENDNSGQGYFTEGVMVAIWQLLVGLINNKDEQSRALLGGLLKQLDEVDAAPLNRSRLDSILARMDNLTTPEAPTLPVAPSLQPLDYTPAALPAVNARFTDLPDLPALRALMEIGAAPVVDEGMDLSLNEFRNLFVSERDQLLALVGNAFDDFTTRFLPESGEVEAAMQWLVDAIRANGTGLPIHIEAQIWERDRARVGKETGRQVATAINSWAAKGYSIPPGAMVGQVAAIRRDAHDQLSTSSREIAIKVTEIHVENARFAVEQMLSLRNQALSQATDYMKAMMLSPQYAGTWITSMLDNRGKVAGIKADLYRAQAGVATDVFRTENGFNLDLFKAATDANLEDVKTSNSTQIEVLRAALEQDRNRFTTAIESFRARTGTELDVYKTTSDSLMRYYESAIRASGLKAEVLGKTADTAIKIDEVEVNRALTVAKLKVDQAMELLKTYAQQASAALNNMQLNSTYQASWNVSERKDSQ